MELNNEFDVALSVAETWEVLTDVERIAPCMPGAELREIEGDEYRGVVKVKLGPISTEYRGAARFVEKDDSSHRAVLRAEGREARGQGNANATITASLEPSGKGTTVSVTTDLQITGKVAQFGRGVLADVSNKLLEQFAENLETTVLNTEIGDPRERSTPSLGENTSGRKSASDKEEGTPEDSEASAKGVATPRRQPQPAEPVDLFEVAGAPVARRVLPVLGVTLSIVAAVALIRRVLRPRGTARS